MKRLILALILVALTGCAPKTASHQPTKHYCVWTVADVTYTATCYHVTTGPHPGFYVGPSTPCIYKEPDQCEGD